MTLDKSPADFLFDSRISSRNIRDGRVERAEFENFIKLLPDLEDQWVEISEKIYDDTKTELAVSGESSREDQERDE